MLIVIHYSPTLKCTSWMEGTVPSSWIIGFDASRRITWRWHPRNMSVLASVVLERSSNSEPSLVGLKLLHSASIINPWMTAPLPPVVSAALPWWWEWISRSTAIWIWDDYHRGVWRPTNPFMGPLLSSWISLRATIKTTWYPPLKPWNYLLRSCSGYNGAVICFSASVGVGHLFKASVDWDYWDSWDLGVLERSVRCRHVELCLDVGIYRMEHTNPRLILHTLSPRWLAKTQYAATIIMSKPGA